MRIIKFRGYWLHGGSFIYGCGVKVDSDATYIVADNLFEMEVEPDSVAQLVGYDTNGNEVYEGDELVDSNGTNFFGALFYTATTRKISDNAPGILNDCVLKEN